MKTKSQWVSVLLALGIMVLVAACGSPAADSTEPTPAVTEAAAAATPTAAVADTSAEVAEAATPTPRADKVPPPDEVSEGPASELEPAERNDMYSAAPEMTLDPNKYYYATFKTDRGDIKVQLFAQQAPLTVNSFVFLAREGFYNDVTFHRVLDGFMAQGGDPTGTGMGGPGYAFVNEIREDLVFDRAGLLAMANSGPDTNGSQFFITFAPTEFLNGGYTIFGEVIEGMDVLNSITRRDPDLNPTFAGDTIYTILIEESDISLLPTPLPPTPTPTPYAPSSPEDDARPLATVEPTARANYYNTAPEVTLDTSLQYTATIKTTKGDLVVALFDDAAPIAVNNFVLLANLGYYDGLPINQNSPENVLIVGSPDNVPNHDVGYQIPAERNVPMTLTVGSLAYVPFQQPAGDVADSGSQLLIARIVPPAEANAQFSFFGRVIGGEDVLAALTTEDTIETVTVVTSE